MDTFPTPPFEATITEWTPSLDEYRAVCAERDRLTQDLESLRNMYQRVLGETQEYRQKVQNVKGAISDVYSEDGEIPDVLVEIARMLDIELTKRISGTASFEISFSAEVPIDFDASDFEISFDVDCETYEAENFDWQEENTSVDAEDE